MNVKDAILDASVALLKDKGIAALTQPQVARAAGIKQSHLTYYFPTRAALLLAIAEHSIDVTMSEVGARLRDHGEDGGLPGASTDYDGVNLLQLRDLAVATDLWNDPETLAIMRPDEPRVFSTYVRNFTLVCREQVLRDGPASPVGVFGFLRRNPAVSKSAFDTAWNNGPQDAWLSAPALDNARRVVHNHVVQTPPEGYDYDAIAEWWFDSADAARAAFADSRNGNANGAPDMRSKVRDLRCQLPAPYSALVDLKQSVFMFTQVTHQRP